MTKNYKIAFTSITAIALAIIFLGVTFAFWTVKEYQESTNNITSACLNLEIVDEKDPVNIENAEPKTDEEGVNDVPYSFTVRNSCKKDVTFQANLELLGIRDNNLSESFLKISYNNQEPNLLNNLPVSEPSISGAYASYKLGVNTLPANSSETYTIKMWIDENAAIDSLIKSLNSRVTITVGQDIVEDN